jgi:hypothetical protein
MRDEEWHLVCCVGSSSLERLPLGVLGIVTVHFMRWTVTIFYLVPDSNSNSKEKLMTATIFEKKTETKRLAKQFDTLTGVELTHIKKTNPALYEELCEAKGIVHGYPVAKDFIQASEKLVSVDQATATTRFSPADVKRYETQPAGNADNLGNMAKNDPEGFKLFKLARETYKSLEPAPARGRIRPTETAPTPTVEHYQRMKPPAAPSNESEGTSVGEALGKRLNLPPETRVSFDDYSKLLLFAASIDAEKNKS